MTAELLEFANCIKNKSEPLASGELGFSVVKTITAIKKATEYDGWVKI
jgi:predicted dehydrogenase